MVDLLAPHERFAFERSTAFQYHLSSPAAYAIGPDLAKSFVIPTRVVLVDKLADLLPKIVRILLDDEINFLLVDEGSRAHYAQIKENS